MTLNSFAKTLATASLFATTATAAAASGWIDSFEIRNTGIDTTPVEIASTSQGYTGPINPLKTFGITIEGAAAMGRRINGLTVGAGDNVSVIEANIGMWTYDFPWHQIGSGTRRTLNLDIDLTIPLASVAWTTLSPLDACNANLNARMGEGWTRAEVLAQEWDLMVTADFSAEMTVVHRFNVKSADETNLGNMQWQRDNFDYHVYVRCLPTVPAGGILAPPQGGAEAGPDRMISIDSGRDDDSRPARQESRPERQETRPERQDTRPERQRD